VNFRDARRIEWILAEEALCQRYGLPYNSAPLYRQFGTTLRKVFQLALPTRGEAALA
jgi:NADPH-dependent stearoyl-CoA 9-desaturase